MVMNAESRRIVGKEMPIKLLKRGSPVSVVTSGQLEIVALSFANTSTHNDYISQLVKNLETVIKNIIYTVPCMRISIMKIGIACHSFIVI